MTDEIVKQTKEGQYELIGGHHRLLAISEKINNPILKTLQIVEDRINEIMETGQVESNVTLYGKLVFYEKLTKNLRKLYTGDI